MKIPFCYQAVRKSGVDSLVKGIRVAFNRTGRYRPDKPTLAAGFTVNSALSWLTLASISA